MAGLRLDPFYDTLRPVRPAVGEVREAEARAGEETRGGHGDHDYGLGVGYRNDGFEGGLQHHEVGGGRTWAPAAGIEDALRGYASYERGRWSVGASYEHVDAEGGEAQEFLFAAATIEASPELTLAAAVGHVGDGAVQPAEGTGFHAGLFYTLYPQAHVHALYSWLDPESGPDRGTLALGLTYHFVLGRP